jgi:hypothetical protein
MPDFVFFGYLVGFILMFIGIGALVAKPARRSGIWISLAIAVVGFFLLLGTMLAQEAKSSSLKVAQVKHYLRSDLPGLQAAQVVEDAESVSFHAGPAPGPITCWAEVATKQGRISLSLEESEDQAVCRQALATADSKK